MKKSIFLLSLLALLGLGVACTDEGLEREEAPMEETREGFEETGEGIEEAGDEIESELE